MDWSTVVRYSGAIAFILQSLLSFQVYKSSRLKTAALLSSFFVVLGLLLLPLNHLGAITGVRTDHDIISRLLATIAAYLTALVAVYLVIKNSLLQLILILVNTILAIVIIMTILQNTEGNFVSALLLFMQSLAASGTLFWQTTRFNGTQIIPMIRLGLIGCVVGCSSVIFADLMLGSIFYERIKLMLLISFLGIVLLLFSILFRRDSRVGPEKTRA